MKKKAARARKRLSLSKSTLRHLSTDRLRRVGGGADTNGCDDDTYWACSHTGCNTTKQQAPRPVGQGG